MTKHAHRHTHTHPGTSSGRAYICSWCGNTGPAHELACHSCGAPVGIEEIVTGSGWRKFPTVEDMTTIYGGNYRCQIMGKYVPTADIELAPREAVFFVHHVLLWKDAKVRLNGLSIDPLGSQRPTREITILVATGPGHIAFSKDAPGEIMALPVDPGQEVDIRSGVFMVGTSNITHDWYVPRIWYKTPSASDPGLHFPLGFIDRFGASASPGLLILHGEGNIYIRDLPPGETVLVRPTSFLFKDTTVDMQLHIETPSVSKHYMGRPNPRHIWLRLSGPGRVAIQSVFDRAEDNGRKIVDKSLATEHRW